MARQGNLFDGTTGHAGAGAPAPELELSAEQLQQWQRRLGAFQAPLFGGDTAGPGQGSLFGGGAEEPEALAAALNPLELRPQPLSFWRWPEAPHQGAAMYFVLDRPPALDQPLLLYVGETGAADRRWKGEHDCKRYLAAYGEALSRAGLQARPSIRFWLDVPTAIKARRTLEQALIRRWQPPFNKETRQRWATPFTADPELGGAPA
jgi:hypothetical protein